jgi:hypothetical protein
VIDIDKIKIDEGLTQKRHTLGRSLKHFFSLEQKLSILGCSVFDADSKKVHVSNVWTILGMVTLPLLERQKKKLQVFIKSSKCCVFV